MKKILIISLFALIYSCATPELCNSYTTYYSKKCEKKDYCQGSKVDIKRKKIFKKYLKSLKKPITSFIMIEYLTMNPDLLGYSVQFINPSVKSYTLAYYKPINNDNVILKEEFFYDDVTERMLVEDAFARYIWENGVNFELDDLKNNEDYMLDMDFGKTIITEFDKKLEIKNSKLFDSVIYLAYLKSDINK